MFFFFALTGNLQLPALFQNSKILFSISKIKQVYKPNTKHQYPCHFLYLNQATDRVHRLLQVKCWSSSASKVLLHNKKQLLANVLYLELVKKREKYSDCLELNNIFYSEKKYP